MAIDTLNTQRVMPIHQSKSASLIHMHRFQYYQNGIAQVLFVEILRTADQPSLLHVLARRYRATIGFMLLIYSYA